MKPTALIFLFLLTCLVAGTLLTYPIVLGALVDAPPHRVATRLSQFCILVGIWPLVRAMGVANRSALGLGTDGMALGRALALGWMGGVVILAVLSLSLWGLGVRLPAPGALDSLARLLGAAVHALVAGLLIAVGEEFFFRGAVFSAVRRRGSAVEAMIWSSLLFALLHFLKPHALGPAYPLEWSMSWALFSGTFSGFSVREQIDSLLALFLAGLLLAAIRERSGHIGYCIGLHAGWVFVIKLTRLLTDNDEGSPYAFLAGNYDGVIGYLAAAWLGLLLLLWWGINRARARQAANPTEPR